MHRRYLIVAMALVVALAAIAPTLGATRQQRLIDKSTFPVRTAKAAKRIAKSARTLANEALTAANTAQQTASDAQSLAGDAKTTANNATSAAGTAQASADAAQATADAANAELATRKAKSDTAAPTVSTTEQNTYVPLPGPTASAPSVTVTAPASGLIEVWAQATITDGAVSLFEDGQKMPNQDPGDNCFNFSGAPPPPQQPLLAVIGGPGPLAVSTPGNVDVVLQVCGSTSAPSPVLLKTSPGQHTYDLRYASCGCSPQADFTDRSLTVAPRP